MRKLGAGEFDELVSFFDRMAETEWLRTLHEALIRMCGSLCGRIVLDIGCGTGRLLEKVSSEARHLIGIDLSPAMIAQAKKRFQHCSTAEKIDFRTGDALNLPLKDEAADITLSTCVQFLLPKPELGFSEMLRVTKRGGTVAMLNPAQALNLERAKAYCAKKQISGFAKESLLQWAKVSERRHRYSKSGLTHTLLTLGAENVHQREMLEGLALLTVASRR